MIARLASLVLAATIDPRIHLVELQGARENLRALEEANCLAEAEPARARALGLDFLRGHLLTELGRLSEGTEAFAQAIGATPDLAPWARYRLAIAQEALGHPEVAAGVAATLLAQGAPKSLVRPGATLLLRAIRNGGDCRLLHAMPVASLGPDTARDLRGMVAECHLRDHQEEAARHELEELLDGGESDLAAFRAAEVWLALWPEPEDRERARTLGTVLAAQRDFAAAAPLLERALAEVKDPGVGRDAETLYLLARAEFWSGHFARAGEHFDRLADLSRLPATRADARYQQARSLELGGEWTQALVAFELAYNADPSGEWSGAALLAALRLRWLAGDEAGAAEILRLLATQRPWRSSLARAALFVAVSEIERGDTGALPEQHLLAAERSGASAEEEIAYWRGRLAELRGQPDAAIELYVPLLRERPFHPLAAAVRTRLARPELARAALATGQRRAAGPTFDDACAAWSLLGDRQPSGRQARARAEAALRAQPALAAWLDWQPVPVPDWPLWTTALTEPEDRLLALGVWSEGRGGLTRYFPTRQPRLAFTLAQRLDAAGSCQRGIGLAESLFARRPEQIPGAWISPDLRRLLFPLPYRTELEKRATAESIDFFLLAAVLREESRFETEAVSPAAARGLAQLVLPTARRLAQARGWGVLAAEDLHRPAISITLGSAYLAELGRRFAGSRPIMVAAYNAGEDQAELWRKYCSTAEPEEYLAKVGFRETRAYLVRVLESRAQYAALYVH